MFDLCYVAWAAHVHFHSNRQGEVVLETSVFLAPLPELFRSLSPLQSVEPIPRPE
jgi:hypothetical protein